MGKKGKRSSRKSTRSSVAAAASQHRDDTRRTKTSSRTSSFSVEENETVPFCVPKLSEPTTIDYIDRPPPCSEKGIMSYLTNLDERLDDILSSDREKASLPTNDQLTKLKSKTAKRVATALARFEIAEYLILGDYEYVSYLLGNIEMGKLAQVPMQELVHKDSFLEACVHIIVALADTDLRLIPCLGTRIPKSWPTPMEQCLVPVKYHPLNQGNIQMHELSNEEFVVLLATALVVGSTNIFRSKQVTLRLIHELYLQAENIDWSTFNSNQCLKELTEEACRNALANMGIKVCEYLYRMKKADRCEGPTDVKFSSKTLLKKIEEFARDLMKYSESGESECVMGWIADQNGCITDIDPLRARADALHWYTKAYTKADEYGNDFISSMARIQAADCIHRGGEGAIRTISGKVILRRDFRSEFGGIGKNEVGKLGVYSLGHTDQYHLQIAVDREWERLQLGKPLTELTSEEEHVICWKKSLTLWNEAIKYYDCMADIGMGHFIYGETSAWANVLSQIKYLVDELKLSLECNFIAPLNIDIYQRKGRDMGVQFCANCHDYDGNKKCSRCKKVFYCSRECQKAHWAKHKLTCCKK